MIRLRPFSEPDAAAVLSWCRDEETFFLWTAGVLGDFPLTEAGFRKTGDLMRFTALEEKNVVGFFTARNPKETLDELRFGFIIVAPDRRGTGVGKEMLRLGLSYAFGPYRADRVTLGVFEENRAAYFCYRAAGFTETGVREAYSFRGETRFAIEMECRRPASGASVGGFSPEALLGG